MKIRIISLISMIAILGVGSGLYAKPCTLTPAKAPMLFGFKLGMAQAAAEKLSGQTAEENKLNLFLSGGKYASVPTGDKYFMIFNEKQSSKVVDKTVEKLSVSFMNAKLFEISIDLNRNSPWVTAPDTAAFFQQKFGIAADAWVDNPEERSYLTFDKSVTCKGVKIEVSAGKTFMTFKMYETAVRARLEAARDEIRKKYADK